MTATPENLTVEQHYFEDEGSIPNSRFPLVIYHHVLAEEGNKSADWLESRFAANHWTNSWRWGVYDFHHYHSNTHEVLGVFRGWALLHLGGEKGEKVKVQAGDVIIIPAGVGHKCLQAGQGFEVVGAYPNGLQPDMNKGHAGERPGVDKNIAAVSFPLTDPLFGENEGIIKLWKQ